MNNDILLETKKFDTKKSEVNSSTMLFENLPKIVKIKTLAKTLDIAVATIYDWKYRSQMRNIPLELFLKINGRLYIRTDVLNNWLLSRNS